MHRKTILKVSITFATTKVISYIIKSSIDTMKNTRLVSYMIRSAFISVETHLGNGIDQ